jgi:hypothetical protein
MTMPHDQPPAKVPETAEQAGESPSRWDWVQRAVWTDRMLTALDEGVKEFFADAGLYDLTTHHAEAVQSCLR